MNLKLSFIIFFPRLSGQKKLNSELNCLKQWSGNYLRKNLLKKKYTQLKQLNSYAIAVNESYAADELVLKENDVIAVIPPVSGG